jgi:hypothetical protein
VTGNIVTDNNSTPWAGTRKYSTCHA